MLSCIVIAFLFNFHIHFHYYVVGSSNSLKISKVVTKSKFGAPSRKRPNQLPLGAATPTTTITGAQQLENLIVQPKRRLIAPNQILPSISTLKQKQQLQQGGIAATGTHNMNQATLLPNDQFTRLYGRPFADDRSTATYQNSVVTLTPPSSPDSEQSTGENVGNLVDEHFRHSMQRFASAGKKTNPTQSTVAINNNITNGTNTNNLVASASVIEQDFAGVVNRLLNGDGGKVCVILLVYTIIKLFFFIFKSK